MRENTIGFEVVYEEYYYAILSFVRSHVAQVEIAQDLTSNIFLAAYKNWDRYDPNMGTMSTWLYCIARNRLKNYYRSKRNDISLDAAGEIGLDMHLEMVDRMQRVIEIRDALADVLVKLPERERKIIVLRYFAEKSNQEIASIMDLSHENIRVILMRTLRKLRKMLDQNGFVMEG